MLEQQLIEGSFDKLIHIWLEFVDPNLFLEIAPKAFDLPGLQGSVVAHFELPAGKISNAITHKS